MGYNVLGASTTLPAPNAGADSARDTLLGPRGEQLTIPAYQQYVHNGRVYIFSNPTKQTALATGGTSYLDTAPAFILDVSAGTTMIPLHVRLRQGGTVAGGVITVLLTTDIVARYSSGGTAITARALKQGNSVAAAGPRTATTVCYGTSPTAAAVNTHISLMSAILTQDVATTPNTPQTRFEWPEPGSQEPLPELVGPASMVIYTFAAVTQPSWFFSFKILELDT